MKLLETNNTPPWVFFRFFKLYRWYQIAQRITYMSFSWQKCEVEVNPFPASVPVLYPLKTLENLWFSGVFRGCKIGTLAGNGLILTIINNIFVFARVVHCLKEEDDKKNREIGPEIFKKRLPES